MNDNKTTDATQAPVEVDEAGNPVVKPEGAVTPEAPATEAPTA